MTGKVVEAIYARGSRRCSVQLTSGERLAWRELNSAQGLLADRIPSEITLYLSWDLTKA